MGRLEWSDRLPQALGVLKPPLAYKSTEPPFIEPFGVVFVIEGTIESLYQKKSVFCDNDSPDATRAMARRPNYWPKRPYP